MKEFITLVVWGEKWCDDEVDIVNSYGYSLSALNDFKEQLKEGEGDYDFSKYRESEITWNYRITKHK